MPKGAVTMVDQANNFTRNDKVTKVDMVGGCHNVSKGCKFREGDNLSNVDKITKLTKLITLPS